jgi:hypothetical protein
MVRRTKKSSSRPASAKHAKHKTKHVAKEITQIYILSGSGAPGKTKHHHHTTKKRPSRKRTKKS